MNTLDSVPVALCVDCVALLANGTLGEDDRAADSAHGDRMAAAWPADSGRWVLAPGSGEAFFSWAPCDGCGSELGGDRFDGVALLVGRAS